LPRKILIVDDNVVTRHSLRSLIELNEELVVCGEAENGKVAVEKVQELRPDVVILDLQMPVMNGLEAAREIATIAPLTPMVVLTLHAHEELVNKAKAAGITEVLSKADAIPSRLLDSLKRLSMQPRKPCASASAF
jgi:DNA-binding NarL/FixJ family response regulator